jgi:enoyl-CoA hydratase/carnithine racemase
MTDFAIILYEQQDGVARLTLNRPERANALNREMPAEMGAALDAAERGPAVRALIVQGAGTAFSFLKAALAWRDARFAQRPS